MSSSAPPPLPPSDDRPPYPGHDLGLPESGPRSIGRFGRRLIALVIDWGIAVLVSVLFFHYNSLATLGVFALMQMLFIITLGGSLGHIACRMRVVPLPTGYIGVWRPIVRTILLCLVIPAVIYDRDQRGLHDRAVGAVLVRI
ncbi:RDD family protein [Frondihabitans sp. PhB188]|uniref:RDD family protein n=1 Tax=Frondihabitans sp. PhB188 TaxID=2485200 RepID=UPI000F4728A5|nr:RDD family protein [Frondihabitans sp. PhB188]